MNTDRSERIDDLKERATEVREETAEGANTHERVGGLLYDLADEFENIPELGELPNVTLSNPTNSQVLAYDSAARQWRNTTMQGGGGGGGGGSTDGYEKMYFQNTTHNVTPPPTKPTVNDYRSSDDTFNNGLWKPYNEQPGSNQDTWAIWVWFQDGTPMTISDPVRIYNGGTGGGSNGEDGEEIEYIYNRSEIEYSSTVKRQIANSLAAFNNGGNKVTSDVEIGGRIWTNHPCGVGLDESTDTFYRCEYIAIRHSNLDENNKRVWTLTFSGPYLWSTFGEQGTDGDGIEYIFYVNDGTTPSGTLDPSSWTISQDPEYIENPAWTDDPQTIEPGQTQWSSIRKKKIPEIGGDGKTAKWGAYSTPVVWSYYAMNGVAEGYIVNLSNPIMPVGTDFDGNVDSYSNSCKVSVYHNGIAMTYSNKTTSEELGTNEFGYTIGEITRSDGESITGITASKNNSTVNVAISNITGFDSKTASIPITVILPGEMGTRESTITLSGTAVGEAGMTIDLYVGAAAIKEDYYHTNVYPRSIDVGVKIGKGSDVTLYKLGTDNAKIAELGFTFSCYYNNDTTHAETLSNPVSPRHSTESLSYEKLTIIMKKDGTVIDSQDVPYVHEPAPGIGKDAVSYDINVMQSTVIKYSNNTVGGNIAFQITRTVGDEVRYLYYSRSKGKTYWVESITSPIAEEEAEEYFEAYINGANKAASFNSSTAYWTVSENGATYNVPYSQIILYSAVHTPLRSVVIPHIMEGDSSGSGIQSINGVVMRFREWSGLEYDTIGDVAIGALAAEDGIIYKDVITYETRYFYISPSYDGSLNPTRIHNLGAPVDASTGRVNAIYQEIPFMGDAAFTTLLAKYAYVENFTAREIVVTSSTNKPVAGITSGYLVSPPDPNTHYTYELVPNSWRENTIRSEEGSVRFWAGLDEDNPNLKNCKFYVTHKGFVHADLGVFTGTIHANDGYFAGTVTANMLYSKAKWVSTSTYTIDVENDPANLYYTVDANHTITLPEANEYEGLILRFLSMYQPTTTSGPSDYGIKLTSNTSIRSKGEWGELSHSYTTVHIINCKVTSLIAVNNEWFVLEGEVRNTVERVQPV